MRGGRLRIFQFHFVPLNSRKPLVETGLHYGGEVILDTRISSAPKNLLMLGNFLIWRGILSFFRKFGNLLCHSIANDSNNFHYPYFSLNRIFYILSAILGSLLTDFSHPSLASFRIRPSTLADT